MYTGTRMKRKSFRDRSQVLLSVEKDRWKDFTELCDKERKSTSFKFDEMLSEELQKNALGLENPIGIAYISNSHETQKRLQCDIRTFLGTDKRKLIENAKILNAKECDLIRENLRIVSRFKRERIIEV